MRTYQTAEIAAVIGVHPNTVRFYEEQGLLPSVPRKANGYRVYSQRHLQQLQLVRLGFKAEILSANLRDKVVAILKTAASMDIEKAYKQTAAYQVHIREEMDRAREALSLAKAILDGNIGTVSSIAIGRREAAEQIGVSLDVLRDWERNGLLVVPRRGNQRQYGTEELNRLKIIAILRHANYSQMAIRRMLNKLEYGETDILATIDSPEPTEDIISVADRYLTSLKGALQDTDAMLQLLEEIK